MGKLTCCIWMFTLHICNFIYEKSWNLNNQLGNCLQNLFSNLYVFYLSAEVWVSACSFFHFHCFDLFCKNFSACPVKSYTWKWFICMFSMLTFCLLMTVSAYCENKLSSSKESLLFSSTVYAWHFWERGKNEGNQTGVHNNKATLTPFLFFSRLNHF